MTHDPAVAASAEAPGSSGDGSWGVTFGPLDLVRPTSTGEAPFRLRMDSAIRIAAGAGRPNRLPVMGPSGAGKSTLLNILSATTYPDSPESWVSWLFPDGTELSWSSDGPSSAELTLLRRDYFGFAFQDSHLIPHLTVAEALTFGRCNRGESFGDAMDRAREAVAKAFGGEERRQRRILGSFPHQLSGGERQRASLLMALVRDPFVLFADEPTGSLDRDTRLDVMNLLIDWIDRDKMLIWVTHHEKDPSDTHSTARLLVSDGTVLLEEVSGASSDMVIA